MAAVLLVHPVATVRREWQRILSEAKFEITEAENGTQAVDILKESIFSLVIVNDLLGSGKNPVQVAEWVRSFQKGMHRPTLPIALVFAWGSAREQPARPFDATIPAPLKPEHVKQLARMAGISHKSVRRKAKTGRRK